MGVLASSADFLNLFADIKTKRVSVEAARERIIILVEPIILSVARGFPLYMREDLSQELRIALNDKFDRVYEQYKTGETKDWLNYISKTLNNSAVDYYRKQKKTESKLVRIDDVVLELVIYPKTYEKTKLIAKIRKAIEAYYMSRYKNVSYAKRASRFAYAILAGKRPAFMTNNLTKFFNGRRHHAQMAYTTALSIIRLVLQQHEEEVRCILED